MFSPKDDIYAAVAGNKRVADYKWGTMLVSKGGAYLSFAWKAWLLVLGVLGVVLFVLTKLR